MKTLAIICYVIGTGVSLTWWLGGAAVVFLIAGCIFQFNEKKHEVNDLIDTERNTHFNP